MKAIQKLEIEKYRYDMKVVRDTADQVIKDLAIEGFEINFSGTVTNAYDELESQLIPVFKSLYQKQQNKFMNMLYRVDVNEKELKSILTNYNGDVLYKELTRAFLERELTKVITRLLFSKKSSAHSSSETTRSVAPSPLLSRASNALPALCFTRPPGQGAPNSKAPHVHSYTSAQL